MISNNTNNPALTILPVETPGHTPEGISILVYDLAKSDKDPLAVLTGGDVCDLIGGYKAWLAAKLPVNADGKTVHA